MSAEPSALKIFPEPGPAAAPDQFPAPAERPFPWIDMNQLRKEIAVAEASRMSSGIPALDTVLGGGISGGEVYTFQGPPGGLKSALAMQLALDRAKELNKLVHVYAPDQGGRQYFKRLASTFGPLAEVAANDEKWRLFIDDAASWFRVADETQGVTMEGFTAEVLRVPEEVAAVIVDTPQTVTVGVETDAEKRRIDLAYEAARKLADALTVPVFVPSHANRAATAAKRKEDRNHPRSAGLGSAGIEHRSQNVLFMELVDSDGTNKTMTDIQVTKCSGGTPGRTVRLELVPSTWRLREADVVAAEGGAREAQTREWRELDDEVYAAVSVLWADSPEPSQRKIIGRVRAIRQKTRGIGISDQAVKESLERLSLGATRLVKQKKGSSNAYTRPMLRGPVAADVTP